MVMMLAGLGTLLFSQQSELKSYDDARLARINYVSGKAFVERSYEQGMEEAVENLPLFESDSLITDNGMVEIYLNRLNYLRIGRNSEVIFKKLPRTGGSELTLFLKSGSIYLDLQTISRNSDFEVQTADCGVFIQKTGIYRVEAGRRSEVYCIQGDVEVAGYNESKYLKSGQTVSLSKGNFYSRVSYFYNLTDELENFQRLRSENISRSRFYSGHYMQQDYSDYEYELNQNGRWVYNYEIRGHVWVPYRISYNWRPYYNGRWIWHPYYGYVWVSYERWGWYTHFYGRWHWDPFYGWCWIPSYHWRGSWVNWYYYGGYYAWCPIDWWGRPIIIINNYWHRDYDWRRHGFPHNSRSTIVIKKDQLRSSRVSEVALNQTAVIGKGELKKLADGPEVAVISKGYLVKGDNNRQYVVKEGALVSKKEASGTTEITSVTKANPGQKEEITSRGNVFRRDNSGSEETVNGTTVIRSRSEQQEKRSTGVSVLGRRDNTEGFSRKSESSENRETVIKKRDEPEEQSVFRRQSSNESTETKKDDGGSAVFSSRADKRENYSEAADTQKESSVFRSRNDAVYRSAQDSDTDMQKESFKSRRDKQENSGSESGSFFGRIFKRDSGSGSSSSGYRSSSESSSSSVVRRNDSSSRSFGGSSQGSSGSSSSSSVSGSTQRNSSSASGSSGSGSVVKKKDGR